MSKLIVQWGHAAYVMGYTHTKVAYISRDDKYSQGSPRHFEEIGIVTDLGSIVFSLVCKGRA